MTRREQTALALVGFGTVLVLAAAYAYDGWRLVALLAGALALIGGVLAALDEPAAPLPPELAGDFEEEGEPPVEHQLSVPVGTQYPNRQDH